MQVTQSRTRLAALLFCDNTLGQAGANQGTQPTTNAPAGTSASDGVNTGGATVGTPTPGEGNNTPTGGTSAAPNAPAGEGSGEAPAPITLTAEELQEQVDKRVKAALAERDDREARKRKKEANQKTRQQAEADNDVEALLNVERDDHKATADELEDQKRENERLTRELAVHKAATRYGLDAQLAELLANNLKVVDEKTADVEAKKLVGFKKVPDAPRNDSGAGNRPAPRQTANNGNGNGAGPRSGSNGSANGYGSDRAGRDDDEAPAPVARRRHAWSRPNDVAYPS